MQALFTIGYEKAGPTDFAGFAAILEQPCLDI
jgi:hypothetical protein